MSKTKIPTANLVLHAHQHLQRILSGLDDAARRKAATCIEAGGAYEVRVCMEINTDPSITLVLLDGCEEHQLHTLGGGPAK